jgi:hypothetical protein
MLIIQDLQRQAFGFSLLTEIHKQAELGKATDFDGIMDRCISFVILGNNVSCVAVATYMEVSNEL